MTSRRRFQPTESGKHVALILVEGETEEEFYKALSQRYFRSAAKRIKNLGGIFNINTKIADACIQFARSNPRDTFDVYVCLDQEIDGRPAYNAKLVQFALDQIACCKSIVPVIAVLMIESLFFIDMDGIYRYLKTPRGKRQPRKFANFRKCRWQDLHELFRQYGRQYHKGFKCKGLIEHLNLGRIKDRAQEIETMISSITSRQKS